MRPRPLVAALVLVTAGLTGCTSSPDGTISLYVAAENRTALNEVHLNVSSIHVRPAGSSADNETGVLKSDRFPDNWVEVAMDPDEVEVTFDGQAGQGSLFFGEGAVPVDEYNGVGILVERVTATSPNGTPVTVLLADAVTDHRTNFSVPGDAETRMVMTLDLNQSLDRREGPEESWVFTPKIGDVETAQVPDDASGEERHSPGERANLSSTQRGP